MIVNRRLDKLIGFIILLSVFGSCCLFVYFSFVSYPSSKTIANRYLNAIINEDFGAAIDLAQYNAYCQIALHRDAILDIEKYGGAEIQNVVIEMQHNTGSDDQLQFARVTFEYRHPDNPQLQQGEMLLVTDHDVPGFRYLCGNTRSEP
ncbi:MAG: hypothetical protein GY796_14700 [Chloroflexi bacterium]|nr:hypothetical protein [Chloroflexota bacterium]